MKTWTWDEIRKILRTPDNFWGVWDTIHEALINTDVVYRPALAAAFSLAKWKDKRYSAPCGLCVLSAIMWNTDCEECSLYKRGQKCGDANSVFWVFDNSDFKDEAAARKMLKILCDIYQDEYNKLKGR